MITGSKYQASAAEGNIVAVWETRNMYNDWMYYTVTDYLGSITDLIGQGGWIEESRYFDAWGRMRSASTWTEEPPTYGSMTDEGWDRGFTGHEHLPQFGIINMNLAERSLCSIKINNFDAKTNGRLYDPVMGRMFSPDPYIMGTDNTQGYNRYTYALNNPLSYTDPTGEIAWFVPIIAGAVIGAYMGGSATNNNFNPMQWKSRNTWTGIVGGAIVGAIGGAGWSFGLAALNGSALVGGNTVISGLTLSGLSQTAGSAVLLGKGISTISTTASMISNSENASRIFAGKFYMNENVSFGEQLLQGVSRYTWEGLQTWAGYNYTQLRNTTGGVSRVDYLGGATFATGENSGRRMGVSLGNYLNVWIRDEIGADFQNRVLTDPLFMHEYGHIRDSRIFGFGYLFGIGIPSAAGAEWTERRANRHAARYFGRPRYGVDWTQFEGFPWFFDR